MAPNRYSEGRTFRSLHVTRLIRIWAPGHTSQTRKLATFPIRLPTWPLIELGQRCLVLKKEIIFQRSGWNTQRNIISLPLTLPHQGNRSGDLGRLLQKHITVFFTFKASENQLKGSQDQGKIMRPRKDLFLNNLNRINMDIIYLRIQLATSLINPPNTSFRT